MARFRIPVDMRAPLSGDVSQTINPWTWIFSPHNSSFSLFSIDIGPSGDPEVEAEVLDSVASYGRQIGRLQDVVAVLLARLEAGEELKGKDLAAAEDFKALLRDIDKVKIRRRRG
ncbi:hypothetical protein ACLE20_07425 [Rhizobium sp. YIM 134829]|uniref:hypothetical protein n=1 Tax=Rhizobium sp. YIM 134829 TaxID=3390453 RepID=UPI00397CDE87